MMYYISKFLEFIGLCFIGIGFILNFPKLMNPQLFGFGLIFFSIGWVIEKYILKK